MKRGFEEMERLVEDPIPAIESAAGDIEMGLVGIEETAAAVATGDIGAAVASGVAAAGEMAAAGAALPAFGLAVGAAAVYEWVTSYENGKRKRKRVIIDRAPDASRPSPPRRGPYLPGPRRAGPERRRFGPTDTPGSSMPPKNTTRGKKRKVGKVMKRKSATKRTVKRKTSSKKKPKKKSANYSTTIKQEVHGQFARDRVSYFGFQATAGRQELFDVAADALLRAVLKRHNLSIRRTDEVVPTASSVPQMHNVRFVYRRTKYADGTDGGESFGDTHNISTGSFEFHVGELSVEIRDKVQDGYYPHFYFTTNASGTTVQFNRKVGDAKLSLSVKRMIKLRNITKNDDGGDTVNSLDTNPLQGRLYKFRHDVPRVNATLYETDVLNWSKFHDRVCTAGVMFGPQRNATNDHDGAPATPALMNQNAVLSSPPPGGRVWDNLSSSKKIGLAPGQSAAHKMAFKFTGTIRQFLAKFATSDYTPPSIGYCHMFGLEQKFKTGATDKVVVEYDCDDVFKGGVTFVREDLTPPTVRSIHAHSSIAT
jgi:hypothetical protein